jgi:hypothetical protein
MRNAMVIKLRRKKRGENAQGSRKEGQTSQWGILPPPAILGEKVEFESELLPPREQQKLHQLT